MSITQTQLGFVLICEEQKEILTPHLRTLPLDDWEEQDWLEELDAIQEAADQSHERAEEMKFVKQAMGPICALHPGIPVAELIHLLPEPERSRVFDIVHAHVTWDHLPVQHVDRQLWHARVEQAILAMQHQSRFSTDDVLHEAGIADDASEHKAATNYATRILRASAGRRIVSG